MYKKKVQIITHFLLENIFLYELVLNNRNNNKLIYNASLKTETVQMTDSRTSLYICILYYAPHTSHTHTRAPDIVYFKRSDGLIILSLLYYIV